MATNHHWVWLLLSDKAWIRMLDDTVTGMDNPAPQGGTTVVMKYELEMGCQWQRRVVLI